ncbi:MAG: hypothetical protein IJW37_01320 [Lachnospiraceae bacterium]|nr:hypothetical protein [Lachnospiraceae bacterium]
MSGNDEHRYDDIIDLPHPVSKKHPQMPLLDRAAQFAPFAALTGHDAAIKETARLTEEELFLDENSKELLDAELQYVLEHLSEHPEVTVTYFQPDERKSGGAYVTVTGRVKKVDMYERRIVLAEGGMIPMDEVIGMVTRKVDKE